MTTSLVMGLIFAKTQILNKDNSSNFYRSAFIQNILTYVFFTRRNLLFK